MGALLASLDPAPDILALQEVTERGFQFFRAQPIFGVSAHSVALRPVGPGEAARRGRGCAILVSPHLALSDVRLLDGLPAPERSLIATVRAEAGRGFQVGSFHAPPGATWHEAKPETFRLIARFLAEQEGPVVFGMDANSPKVDHPDFSKSRWYVNDPRPPPGGKRPPGEEILIGPEPSHRLRDVLRTWLEDHPEEFNRLMSSRPDGPLAVSHNTGHKGKFVPRRYYHIWASPEFGVAGVRYSYDESIAAGSDHSLVVADLELG
jgi:endonuclease/exonuclease/phosphatase family metal-dependent hydrolase